MGKLVMYDVEFLSTLRSLYLGVSALYLLSAVPDTNVYTE